jgi:hypothetical protein
MKLTEKEFVELGPCQEAIDFAKARGFDFYRSYNECQKPDWILWLLGKTGNMSQEQALKLSLTFEQEALPIYLQRNPKDQATATTVLAASNFDKFGTQESKEAVDAAVKSCNGLFVSVRIAAAKDPDTIWISVIHSMRIAMIYATIGIRPSDPQYDTEFSRQEERLSNVIRGIIPSPFDPP